MYNVLSSQYGQIIPLLYNHSEGVHQQCLRICEDIMNMSCVQHLRSELVTFENLFFQFFQTVGSWLLSTLKSDICLETYDTYPSCRLIQASIQCLKIFVCDCEIIHIRILLDPTWSNRLRQWHKALEPQISKRNFLSEQIYRTICKLQRIKICAAVLLYFLTDGLSRASSRYWPRVRGLYASMTTPFAFNQFRISWRESHGCIYLCYWSIN